jgi:hypothetical protein
VSSQNERQRINWRRNKVLELSCQGHSQPEISRILRVSLGTVNKDLQSLRRQAHENLQKHIQHTLPEEYQNCMSGMKQVLRLSWQIANSGKQNDHGYNDNNSNNTFTTGDDRTRLQALSLINDCYRYIMELTTNGVIITDAIKFVQTNKEKLMSPKEDSGSKENEEHDYDEDKDQLEEKQEKETGGIDKQETTNKGFLNRAIGERKSDGSFSIGRNYKNNGWTRQAYCRGKSRNR